MANSIDDADMQGSNSTPMFDPNIQIMERDEAVNSTPHIKN